MITVRFRLDVSPACSIGPGKIALLQGIQESGSLRRAAHQLGMSYRRAWLLVDGLNRSFNTPVTMASVGGKGGGGVKLTELGEDLVRRYGVLSRKFENLARRGVQDRCDGVGPPGREDRARARGGPCLEVARRIGMRRLPPPLFSISDQLSPAGRTHRRP